MSMISDPATRPNEEARTTAGSPKVRPFYWSLQRELWDNRSIYLAPAAVAAVQIVGFCFTTIGLAARRSAVLLLDPAKTRAGIEEPYDAVAMMMIFTAFIVGVFYCLDALYGERRDRSILFWKSLPVSDLVTVAAKATMPLVVLPALVFIVTVIVQLLMLVQTGIVLVAHGMSPASTWAHVPFFLNWFALLYGLVVLALWHAPIYGWLLVVSAWARKATFLWAVLPLLAVSTFERITFGTKYFALFLQHRLLGSAAEAFDLHRKGFPVVESLSQLTPGRYLATPGLWLGLVVAAVFLVAAARLRRARAPL